MKFISVFLETRSTQSVILLPKFCDLSDFTQQPRDERPQPDVSFSCLHIVSTHFKIDCLQRLPQDHDDYCPYHFRKDDKAVPAGKLY